MIKILTAIYLLINFAITGSIPMGAIKEVKPIEVKSDFEIALIDYKVSDKNAKGINDYFAGKKEYLNPEAGGEFEEWIRSCNKANEYVKKTKQVIKIMSRNYCNDAIIQTSKLYELHK